MYEGARMTGAVVLKWTAGAPAGQLNCSEGAFAWAKQAFALRGRMHIDAPSQTCERRGRGFGRELRKAEQDARSK